MGAPLSCGAVYVGPAIGVLANSSTPNATVDAAREACAAAGGGSGCIWDPSVLGPDGYYRGQCGSCFVGSDCVDGACDTVTHECIACSGDTYCNGHGVATQGGVGVRAAARTTGGVFSLC